VTHCDGPSGIYSREYGYDCTTTHYPSTPEHTQNRVVFNFLYEAQVIMPDGARLNLDCSDISSKHCEGFPSYPEKTQVTCNSWVIAQTFYNTCTAVGPASERIGFYEAERDGDKVVIYGTKWKREYKIRGSWNTAITPPESWWKLEPSAPPSSAGTLDVTAGNNTPIDPLVMAKAKAGDAVAQFDLGYAYYLGQGVPKDYVQAALWFRKAADQGDAVAQHDLGVLYENGFGVLQDYAQAATWYREAADQGNAEAQSNLGLLYNNGQGVPQDYAQAAAWYRKSAEQGYAGAQNNLGSLYEYGFGVPQSYADAYFWFNLAASGMKGSELDKVVKNRDDCASKLSPAELSRAQERAVKWFTEHQANLLTK
jgi:TPR repeat protein